MAGELASKECWWDYLSSVVAGDLSPDLKSCYWVPLWLVMTTDLVGDGGLALPPAASVLAPLRAPIAISGDVFEASAVFSGRAFSLKLINELVFWDRLRPSNYARLY